LAAYNGIAPQVDSLCILSRGNSGAAPLRSFVSSDAMAFSQLVGVDVVPVVGPDECSGDGDFSITLLPSGMVDIC
jgi:hypothetical protein